MTMRSLICGALATAILAGATPARADAVLQGPKGNIFPTDVKMDVQVRAQVEVTTTVLTFPALTDRGDHVLTVPSPAGSYPVGVDMDRGSGFSKLPIKDEAPPPPAGGSSASAAQKAWVGDLALTSNLRDLAVGPLTLRVRFLRLLRRHKGKVAFKVGAGRCPLRASSSPGPAFSLTARVRTARAMQDIKTTDAPLKLQKNSPTEAVLTAAKATLTGAAFSTVSYEEQSKGITAQFLAHRTPSADPMGGKAGYFMLLLDADNVSAETTQPRTLSLVIDRSGSMGGSKMVQAKEAALAMLDNLREGDRFNIHSFDDKIESWSSAPQPANTSTLAGAASWAKVLYARGSTDLNNGIIAGLGGKKCPAGASPGSRYDAMILLSDGLPTFGVQDKAAIHKNSITYNCNEARIFTFAVGYGADAALLEAVARTARGRNYKLDNSQANTALAKLARQLFEDIYAVRVTDLSLAVTGIATEEVLPERPPDLYNGGQVLLVGRYKTPGTGTARVTGRAEGKAQVTDVALTAPVTEADNAFIKYVWATEKVGNLLAAMGKGGDYNTYKKQITALGLAYRIQTPFTSFSTPSVPGGSSGGGSSGGGSSGGGGYSSGGFSGSGDVGLLTLLALLGLVPLARRRT